MAFNSLSNDNGNDTGIAKADSLSVLFPILLFCIVTFSELLIRYRKCTHPIPATYVSFTERSHRGIHHYFPPFSFYYNGQSFEVTSFIHYSKRKLNKLLEENNTYEVFIINIHPRSGWYFIFGQSPKRYWQRTSASFSWPASHAIVTYYP